MENIKLKVEIMDRCPECGGFVPDEGCNTCFNGGMVILDPIEINISVIDKTAFINTCPHKINGVFNGKDVIIPPSGYLLNAKPEEKIIEEKNGIVFTSTKFVGTHEGWLFIQNVDNSRVQIDLKEKGSYVKDIIIIGSQIAVNVYPGVCGLTPMPGFERVSSDEKKMNLNKFNVVE